MIMRLLRRFFNLEDGVIDSLIKKPVMREGMETADWSKFKKSTGDAAKEELISAKYRSKEVKAALVLKDIRARLKG